MEDAADALFLVGTGVLHVRTGRKLSGVGAHEAQAAHEGISGNLEGKPRERLAWIGLALHFDGLVVGIGARDALHVVGRRQVHHHGVQHGLHTFVLEGRAAQDGCDVHGDGRLANRLDNLFFGEAVWVLKVLLHQGVVLFSRSFDELFTVLRHGVQEVLRHGNLVPGHALVLLVPNVGFVVDQVDDTSEGLFCSNGHLQGHRACTQHLLDHADHIEEVCT